MCQVPSAQRPVPLFVAFANSSGRIHGCPPCQARCEVPGSGPQGAGPRGSDIGTLLPAATAFTSRQQATGRPGRRLDEANCRARRVPSGTARCRCREAARRRTEQSRVRLAGSDRDRPRARRFLAGEYTGFMLDGFRRRGKCHPVNHSSRPAGVRDEEVSRRSVGVRARNANPRRTRD